MWVRAGSISEGGATGNGYTYRHFPTFQSVSWKIIWLNGSNGNTKPNTPLDEIYVRNKLSSFSYDPNGYNIIQEYSANNLNGLTADEFSYLFSSNNPQLILNYLIKDKPKVNSSDTYFGNGNMGVVAHIKSWVSTPSPHNETRNFEDIPLKVVMTQTGFRLCSLGTLSFTFKGENRTYNSSHQLTNTTPWSNSITASSANIWNTVNQGGIYNFGGANNFNSSDYNGYTKNNPHYRTLNNYIGNVNHQWQELEQYATYNERCADTFKWDENWEYVMADAADRPFDEGYFLILESNHYDGSDTTLRNIDFLHGLDFGTHAGEVYTFIEPLYSLNYVGLVIPGNEGNYLIDIDEWTQYVPDIAKYCYKPTKTELNGFSYVISPDVKLIGDSTSYTLTVPTGNTDILSYTIGEPIDKTHMNVKTLQINAPTSYSEDNLPGFMVNSNMPMEYWEEVMSGIYISAV